MRNIVRLSFALPMLLLLALPARSGDVVQAGLMDTVAGTANVTYLDLARQIVPDIAAAGNAYEGHKVVDIRHIGGDEMAGEAPETLSLTGVGVLPVHSDGKDRLLVMLDLGQTVGAAESYTALALFNVAGPPTLLDAVLVGYDQLTAFNEPARLPLGEGKDAVITRSSHFNSNQGYFTTVLMLVRNDRLQLVDDFFTFHDRACGFVRDEVIDFGAGDRDARTYSDIVVTVTETTEVNDLDCGSANNETPKPGTRTVTASYRWDEAASKFVPDSDAIDKLEQENMDRL